VTERPAIVCLHKDRKAGITDYVKLLMN
jgi:hypothetical protein